jgi:hypothetical protein
LKKCIGYTLSVVLRISSEINNNRPFVSIYGEVNYDRSWLESTDMSPENPTSSNKPTTAHCKKASEIGLGKTRTGRSNLWVASQNFTIY